MKLTIEALVNDDHHITEFYNRARGHWEQILHESAPVDITSLAKHLSFEQTWFEQHCGGQWLGQEIMVMVGIAQFYSSDDGFAERRGTALAVAKALRESGCSVEVKQLAENIANGYYLFD